MVFSSFLFLFLFLPLVVVINRHLPIKYSNLFLLLASLLFYFAGEGLLVFILIGSIAWNYIFGLLIGTDEKDHTSKVLLFLGVLGNLALLFYYKYIGFIIESSFLKNWISSSVYSEVILPVGISFFTFQGLSYLVDVYRKVEPATFDYIKLGLFISFFPQLIAGPIVKYKELASYLSERTITTEGMVEGSQKFLRGLAKKVLLADSLALVADAVFVTDYGSLPTLLAWLGLLCYTLQIYYDFSGYSDMAIGLCLVLGFKIPENFSHPYAAQSVREFWRRWHISLSTWFRDYLYIPLGGNRKGSGRTYFNLLLVFFVTGLWHGANYNFIVWGLLHGFFMILERVFPSFFEKIPGIFRHLYLLTIVSLAWVFFRTDTFAGALCYFKALFRYEVRGDWLALLHINYYMGCVILLSVILIFPVRLWLRKVLSFSCDSRPIANYLCYLSLAFICMMEMTVSDYSPFIYFKF